MHVQPRHLHLAAYPPPPHCSLARVSTLLIIRDSVSAASIPNCTNETYTVTI